MPRKPAMSPSDTPPDVLLEALPDARREEALTLMGLMGEVTGEPPTVWASRIIGFGRYQYRYESGHEGTAPLIGFAPSQRHHTIYLIGEFGDRHQRDVSKLGKFTHGRSCLNVKRLSDIDLNVLRTLIDRTVRVHKGVDKQYD
jgi:hypothetical protein